MASYKVLKSVAHNLGHSYLSLMNWQHENYVVEHLFQRAKSTGEREVRIDALAGTIEPPAFQTPVLLESVAGLRGAVARMAQTGGAALDMVNAVRMVICFDLHARRYSDSVPDLELAVYDCTVEILDDRGTRHTAKVEEWWRY